ncbi:MAG TPA: glycine cleavage system protein GcvH, partial [Rikenellaceae bacterium]|nr:glycine cleavage system protein GcvH [Rikenellaceae bacterium]
RFDNIFINNKFIMSKVIEGLRYSEDHEWVKVEGNIAVIGISDFAQKELGDITYADLPEVDDEVEAGEEFGALESVKASSELLSPVSGKVVEVNPDLEDAPEKINEDAYEAWIIKVEMSDPSQVDALMDAEAYKAHTEK